MVLVRRIPGRSSWMYQIRDDAAWDFHDPAVERGSSLSSRLRRCLNLIDPENCVGSCFDPDNKGDETLAWCRPMLCDTV